MLYFAVGILCWLGQVAAQLTCPYAGTAPITQSGYNYAIDSFVLNADGTTLTMAFAIDRCTLTSILSSASYYMYQCSESNGLYTLTKTQYSDSACSQSPTVVATWTEGEYLEGDVGYFQCGQKDGSAEVTFSTGSDCVSGDTKTIYVGLGGCGNNIQYSATFVCDTNKATMQLFIDFIPQTTSLYSSTGAIAGGGDTIGLASNSGVCNPVAFCDAFSINSTCGLIFEAYHHSLYGMLNSCMGNGVTLTTTTSISTSTTKATHSGAARFTLNFFLFYLIGTLLFY